MTDIPLLEQSNSSRYGWLDGNSDSSQLEHFNFLSDRIIGKTFILLLDTSSKVKFIKLIVLDSILLIPNPGIINSFVVIIGYKKELFFTNKIGDL